MADNNNTGSNSGFKLPSPTSGGTQPVPVEPVQSGGGTSVSTASASNTSTMSIAEIDVVSSRDFLIGGGILLVLLVAFFFAKNAYANSLVGKRIQPRSANAAGWWLFVFLALISVSVILATISRSVLMTPYIVGPLAAGALVALVLTFVTARR